MRHGGHMRIARFSPDGKKVLTAGDDRTARIWDAATGKQIGPAMVHDNEVVLEAAFSPDGKRLYTTTNGGKLRIWDITTRRQLSSALNSGVGDRERTECIFVNTDGKRLLTGSDDGVIRVWEIEGDMDIPLDLFELQIKVATGLEYNTEIDKIQPIESDKWRALEKEYFLKGMDHYKNCKHRNQNLWGYRFPMHAATQ